MPIKIPNLLPATQTLLEENIFVMTETRAITQDIRPLHILMLNLMPKKIDTETQIARLLGNSPLQVDLTLLQTATHKAKHTSAEHMLAFYRRILITRLNMVHCSFRSCRRHTNCGCSGKWGRCRLPVE